MEYSVVVYNECTLWQGSCFFLTYLNQSTSGPKKTNQISWWGVLSQLYKQACFHTTFTQLPHTRLRLAELFLFASQTQQIEMGGGQPSRRSARIRPVKLTKVREKFLRADFSFFKNMKKQQKK